MYFPVKEVPMNWLAKWAWMTLGAATAIAASAQTLTTLATFTTADGNYPETALIQGSDGDLYGTLAQGGANDAGAIFKISPATGELTVLYHFCAELNCTDGAEPSSSLVEASDGHFYGMTIAGGTSTSNCYTGVIPGCGTVFRITRQGKLTTLYSMCTLPDCIDGAQPLGALVQAADRTFFGTTSFGGAYNRGTVFVITAQGKLLHSFNLTKGDSPGALVRSSDGNFYGTTAAGGGYYNSGTVFKITPHGKITTLYSFCGFGPPCVDGQTPMGVIQGTNGRFYGTTSSEGPYGGGTVFEITGSGEFKTMYGFCARPSCADGNGPSRLIQGSDGQLYGTTSNGGAYFAGAIFKITLSGQEETLYSFCAQPNCTDGNFPLAGLVQATDGKFYGTTAVGGTNGGFGTVFSFEPKEANAE